MLQPLVRRTLAPRGRTPVLACWKRHDRLSVAGVLSRAPYQRRLGLYFTVQRTNLTVEQVAALLRSVQRGLRRGVTVVLDRWAVHRKLAKALAADDRFCFEWLPAYAPELNPVEYVWGHTKYDDLANYLPDDLLHLELEVDWSMQETRRRPHLLRSFFYAAKLEL